MANERTLYITNLHENVTKDILEDIFTQAGPVESVSIINNNNVLRYAFVQFYDEESVPYSIKLMDNLKLFDTPISVRPRAYTEQERIYRAQYGPPRRHSAGPSRSFTNNYEWHHSRRSLNENAVNIAKRSGGKQSAEFGFPSSIPLRDVFSTPVSHKRRIVGGYYQQPPRNHQQQQPSMSQSHNNLPIAGQRPPCIITGASHFRGNIEQPYSISPPHRKIRRSNFSGNGLGESWR